MSNLLNIFNGSDVYLNLSNKDALNNLCSNGVINKDDYLKVCRYFNLNEKSPRYIKYCNELIRS